MPKEIKELRRKIDDIDDQLIQTIAERAKICKDIGATKKNQNLPVHDAKREAEVYERIRQKAVKLGLNPIQVEAVYREIVNMCSSVQE